MMRVVESHRVPDDAGRARINRYGRVAFSSLPSGKSVKKALKKGLIIADGTVCGEGGWVTPGQQLDLLENDTSGKKIYPIPVSVLYEDSHCAVVEKPQGLETTGSRFKTLENALPEHLAPSGHVDRLKWPRPAHRLDYGTGGLIAVAKTSSAMVGLSRQFENRKVVKRYRVIVIGRPPETGAVDVHLDGRDALTCYRLVASVPSLKNGYLSLLDVFPRTGRYRQIRRHLSGIGYPVLGDRDHGVKGMIFMGKGMFLYAVEMTFRHPVYGWKLNINTVEPPKFAKILSREKEIYHKNHLQF